MRGCQPRNNLVKDKNSDLLVEFHNILNRWKKYFYQLLNVHSVNDVKKIQRHAAGPLVPERSRTKCDNAIVKLERYKSPGGDRIQAELIQAGGETFLSVTHELINSILNKKDLPVQRKESITVFIYKKGDQLTVVIIVRQQ
jgi:hypothetical protein